MVEALGGVPEGDPEVPRPAAGDEPVRQQRSVNGQGLGAVPAGDGSASDPLTSRP